MPGTALNAKDTNISLTCNDVLKSIDFYTKGLGFEIVHKMENEGKIQYVAMKAGNAQIGLGQDDFKKGKDRKKGVGVRFWLGTDQDVTAIAARAKAAGIKLDAEPAKLPWGPMAFAITDPDGFLLTISNPMTD